MVKPMSMPDSLSGVREALHEGRRWPVILLCGNNEYLKKEAADGIIEMILPEASRSLALEVFEGSSDPARIVDALRTYSFIPGTKIVWTREVAFFGTQKTNRDLLASAAEAYSGGRIERATDLLLEALATAGWSLEEVADGGWRRMPDGVWHEGMGCERDVRALDWLDSIIGNAVASGRRIAMGDTAILEEALEQGWPEGHMLLLSASAVDRRTTLYKAVAKRGPVVDCSIETRTSRDRKDAAVKSREVILERLRELGKSFRPDALRSLEERVGADPGRLSQEIEKLAAYAGDARDVTKEDVEALVEAPGEAALYELNAAVLSGETSRSLLLMRRILESGCHPLAVVSSLANEVRRMIRYRGVIEGPLAGRWRQGLSFGEFEANILPIIKEAGIESSGHPYALYQAYLSAGRLDPIRVCRLHGLLLQTDLALKGAHARFALDQLILR